MAPERACILFNKLLTEAWLVEAAVAPALAPESFPMLAKACDNELADAWALPFPDPDTLAEARLLARADADAEPPSFRKLLQWMPETRSTTKRAQ